MCGRGQELIGVSFYRIALLLASQALGLFYHRSEEPLSTRRMSVGQILSKSATVEEVYRAIQRARPSMRDFPNDTRNSKAYIFDMSDVTVCNSLFIRKFSMFICSGCL